MWGHIIGLGSFGLAFLLTLKMAFLPPWDPNDDRPWQ